MDAPAAALPTYSQYLRTEVSLTKSGHYQTLNVVGRKGSRLALDDEVVPVDNGTGENTFALTEEAVKVGALRLEWQQGRIRQRKAA